MDSKDIKVNLIAENRQALRSVRELQRQVDKIADLSSQGQGIQGGFLSPKQVQMFRNIVKEMEGTYESYYDKLNKMQEDYERKVERANEKIIRNQERLERNKNDTRGGGEWSDTRYGGQPTPIQRFYESKVNEGKAELEGLSGLEEQIASLNNIVGTMAGEINTSQSNIKSINSMHQMDPGTERLIEGLAKSIGGSAMAFGGLKTVGYTFSGMDLIREGNLASVPVGMRTDYDGDDQQVRLDARELGRENQYTAVETSMLQASLLTGGNQNRETLEEDTRDIQQFSRAYALDANQIATDATALQRMGAMEEGEMNRFAELIGGAVNRGNMRGREEELLRSTSSLMSSISTRMSSVSEEQFGNVLGLQSALGESIPELRGERGAQRLQNIDQGIRSGDGSFDVIMGKGVDYVGIEGMWDLALRKDQGITNPQNLIDFVKGANTHFGGNQTLVKQAMTSHLNLSPSDVQAMEESGFLERIQQGDLPTADEFADIGATDIAQYAEMWDENSTARDRLQITAEDERMQSQWGYGAEKLGTGLKEGLHGLPDWMKMAIIGGSTIGTFGAGSLIARHGGTAIKSIKKRFGPTIGKTPPTSGGATGTLATMGKEGLSKLGEGTTKLIETVGKRAPVIGSVVGTGIDQAVNPEHDWGRSITKGITGTLGGLIGGGLGIASGIPTGGLGWLSTGALATGGAVAGEKVGDSLYSFFAGDDDKQVDPVETANLTSSAGFSAGVAGMANLGAVSKPKEGFRMENVEELAKGITRESKNADNQEITVNIKLSGSVEGMSEDNEDKVTQGILSNLLNVPLIPGLNLSLDMNRGGR